jgi:hypothetical protein
MNNSQPKCWRYGKVLVCFVILSLLIRSESILAADPIMSPFLEKKLSEYNSRVATRDESTRLRLRIWVVSGGEIEIVRGIEVSPEAVVLLDPMKTWKRRKTVAQGEDAKVAWNFILKSPLWKSDFGKINNSRSVDSMWLLVDLSQINKTTRIAFNHPWEQKSGPGRDAVDLYQSLLELAARLSAGK